MKKPSSRKCVGCQEIKEKSSLIRIMKLHNSPEIIVLPTSKHFGRSSYLCYNRDCLENALKKRRFQKSLRGEVSPDTIECIKKILNH